MEPGKGSVFSIYLPLTRRPETSESTLAPGKKGSGGDERILLVDDEEAIVKLGIRILEKSGYTVTGKSSAKEALGAV